MAENERFEIVFCKILNLYENEYFSFVNAYLSCMELKRFDFFFILCVRGQC